MQVNSQTFFFFHTTLSDAAGAEKHTNTLWPSSMWPAVSKKLNPWPGMTLLKSQTLFRKLTNVGLWNGHCFCKWTQGASSRALSPKKTQDKHSKGARWYSPGPGDHGKIQPHPCWVPVLTPVCCWNAGNWRPKIFRISRLAFCCVLRPEQQSHSLHWREACWSYQRKSCLFQALYSLQ